MTVAESCPAKQRETTSGTREWADHNVNCVKGCSNDCRYCYARIMAKRFGRCTEDTWKDMVVNHSAVERKYGKFSGRVMFPSSHDIIDKPGIQEACFIVIRKLLEAGNNILITTKPRLPITKDVVEQFYSFREQLQFRFTITSLDNQSLSYWEPNAPTYEERLASLRYAHEKAFKTSVSVEPFLDYTPQTLIHMVSPYVTESIWLGPMNYIPQRGIDSAHEHHYAEVRRNYETDHLLDICEDLKSNPLIRFKDSIANRLNPTRRP